MGKNTNTADKIADAATDNAIATRDAEQTALADTSQYVDNQLLTSEQAIAEAMEAAREMEMSFVTYTKPEELFKLSEAGSTFNIMDVVTVLINDTDPKRDADQKPVHVFQLVDLSTELEYFTMLGVNPVRDRIASGFLKNRLIGRRMQAGPVKLSQTKVAKYPQPAWTFATQRGFRIIER